MRKEGREKEIISLTNSFCGQRAPLARSFVVPSVPIRTASEKLSPMDGCVERRGVRDVFLMSTAAAAASKTKTSLLVFPCHFPGEPRRAFLSLEVPVAGSVRTS